MSSKIKLSFTLKKSDERKLEDRKIIKYRRDNRLRYGIIATVPTSQYLMYYTQHI